MTTCPQQFTIIRICSLHTRSTFLLHTSYKEQISLLWRMPLYIRSSKVKATIAPPAPQTSSQARNFLICFCMLFDPLSPLSHSVGG